MNIKNSTRSLPSLDILSSNNSKNYFSKRSFISYCTKEGSIFDLGSFVYLRVPLDVDTSAQTGREWYEHPTYVEVKGSYIESLLTTAGNHPINFSFTHRVILPFGTLTSTSNQVLLASAYLTIDQELTESTTNEIPSVELTYSTSLFDWPCFYNTYFKAVEFCAPLKPAQRVTIKGTYLLM